MYIWPGFFIQFSGKISTGFQESGCKTLSLLSSPFVQFHFKAITRNNRNNQTFIPCKTRSPHQNKLSILWQKWVATQNKKKKDNLGFVSPSGVKGIKPRLTLFSILDDIYICPAKNYFWHPTHFLYLRAAKWYLCLGPLLRGFFYVNRKNVPKCTRKEVQKPWLFSN